LLYTPASFGRAQASEAPLAELQHAFCQYGGEIGLKQDRIGSVFSLMVAHFTAAALKLVGLVKQW